MFTQDISSSSRTMLPYSPRAWSTPEICSSPWPPSIAFNENTSSSLRIVLDLGHNLYELSSNSLASSSTLSCMRLLFAKFAIHWYRKGGSNSKSAKRRTQEQATNVSPDENSFFPTPMTTLSRVKP